LAEDSQLGSNILYAFARAPIRPALLALDGEP
jgi:hypothetical protein